MLINKCCAIHWVVIHVLDSVLQSFNNWAQLFDKEWLLQFNFPFVENAVTLPTKRCRVDQVGLLHFKAV